MAKPGCINKNNTDMSGGLIFYDSHLLESAVLLAEEITYAFSNGVSNRTSNINEFRAPLDKTRKLYTLCDLIIHLYVQDHDQLPPVDDYDMELIDKHQVFNSDIIRLALAALRIVIARSPKPYKVYELGYLIETLIMRSDIRDIKTYMIDKGLIRNNVYHIMERIQQDLDGNLSFMVRNDETASFRYDFQESENNDYVDSNRVLVTEAIEEYPELELIDIHSEHDCISGMVKWINNKPITLFDITIPAYKKIEIDRWIQTINKRVALEQSKDTGRSPGVGPIIDEEDDIYIPYTGTSGGGTTYSVTPTGLGQVITITHLGETLDLSDYDNW